MKELGKTKYVIVNSQGTFLGKRKTEFYRNIEIQTPGYAVTLFNKIAPSYPDVQEVHVMSSETAGTFAMPGTPSDNPGENAWCRAKFTDDTLGDWVFLEALVNPDFCASTCTVNCMRNIRSNEVFRSAVFTRQR